MRGAATEFELYTSPYGFDPEEDLIGKKKYPNPNLKDDPWKFDNENYWTDFTNYASTSTVYMGNYFTIGKGT